MDLAIADYGSYFSYDHAASNTPILQELLSFPGPEKTNQYPSRGRHTVQIFGTFLLENDDRAKLDNIISEANYEVHVECCCALWSVQLLTAFSVI